MDTAQSFFTLHRICTLQFLRLFVKEVMGKAAFISVKTVIL